METEQIRRVNIRFSKEPLEEKTFLFIENFYCGARGVITGLFNKYLMDPVYKEYKLVCMTQDYDETVKKYGHWVDSERIWFCVKNGHDHVRYLNTAKYIFTAENLPNFYIKREGQEVFFAPADLILARKRYETKAMLFRLAATMNNADHLIIDKCSEKTALVFLRDRKKDIITISEETDRLCLIKPRKKVFISLLNTARGVKNINTFQYIYGLYTALADAYGYDVHWKIPNALFSKYIDDEYISETYVNVNSADQECLSLMHQADIVIADTLSDVLTACNICDDVIYYADTEHGQTEESEDSATGEDVFFTKDVYAAGGIEILTDLFEMKLEGRKKLPKGVDDSGVHEIFDCPDVLRGSSEHRIIKKNMPKASEIPKYKADRPEVLITVEMGFPEMTSELHEMLCKYREDLNITVLYRSPSKGMLYEKMSDLGREITYICRSGTLQCGDEEAEYIKKKEIDKKELAKKDNADFKEQLETAIRNEWLRMLGREDFDYAFTVTGVNIFWLNMCSFIPAKGGTSYKQKDTAKATVKEIENKLKAYIKKTKLSGGGHKK